MPVILGIGSLEEAEFTERLPLLLHGEGDMPGRSAAVLHDLHGGLNEMCPRLAFRKAGPHKHAGSCHGGEWNGGLKLGIITPACPLIGLGPGMIEDIFTVGMRFEIAWHERGKCAAAVPQCDMGWKPAHFCRSRSAFLKREKKCVSQERI